MDSFPDQKEKSLDVFIGKFILCLKPSYQFCCKQVTSLATRMSELKQKCKNIWGVLKSDVLLWQSLITFFLSTFHAA